MKKATIQLMALFAIVAMATACGTDTTTKTTVTDSGSAATDAGTGGTDGTAATDAGTAATDAGTAATDAGTAATDAGATATYGKGCSGADDQAFFGAMSKDAALAGSLNTLVGDCTLKKGCLAKSGAQAKKDCIVACIVADKVATDNKLSKDCASCLGIYKGFCGYDKCLPKCAADTAAQQCTDCLKTNCDGEYDKCFAGDK